MPFTKNNTSSVGRRKRSVAWWSKPDSAFVTLNGAAKASGLPLQFLRKSVSAGYLPHMKFAGSKLLFINRTDLATFLNRTDTSNGGAVPSKYGR